MKGFFRRLRDIWIIGGISLLFFILIEIVINIYFLFSASSDRRIEADCYEGADWVTEYYKEFSACNSSEWKPYVYYRRKPFTGNYINVSDENLRKTIYQKKPASDYDPDIKIFMFGGSSMWGTGVRDEYTLPSLVGNELTNKGYKVSVVNFGESGYVSTQELIELELQLRAEHVPDIVLFLDGANDAFSSLQQNKAGIPQNEYNRVKEFNTLTKKKRSFLVFIESLKSLATIKFIRQKFLPEPNYEALIEDIDMEKLAGETMDLYNENIRIVYALSKENKFKSIFYNQPLIFYKNRLTDYEKAEWDQVAWTQPFIMKVRNKLTGQEIHLNDLDFYDISDFFMNEPGPIFIDWCHVGEFGNTKLAKRMAADLIPMCDSVLIQKSSFER